MTNDKKRYEFGSFRDPSGFIFTQDGILLRQVNHSYRDNYDLLIESGLYSYLTQNNMLITHKETAHAGIKPELCYKVIKPEMINFISYPYEWSFTQLKDAALLTLDIQTESMKHGMSLKDCSAYNIQFDQGRPLFIDSLSLEKLKVGQPWVAYKQFCQHFLAPLSLMSYCDVRLNQLLRVYLDGVPLDLTALLLPKKSLFNFPVLTHIHLHAKAQRAYSEKRGHSSNSFSHNAFMGIIDSLKTLIKGLTFNKYDTEWGNYYQDTNYSSEAFSHKEKLVSELLEKVKPKVVCDLGANTGLYSRIASEKAEMVISCDIDPAAVELNYLNCKINSLTNIMPILIDITNPSPGLGWENHERMSFQERGKSDTVLALALIHHLAITNNLPLYLIAKYFSEICDSLIIEFIPKNDSQVQRMLASREDIFPDYNQAHFEHAFQEYFKILQSTAISDSERTLYLMERRNL